MVDIHSHILPGLDDGAETLEEAVEMVQMAARHGTTDIVATPHSNLQFAFQPELIDEKIRELEQASGNVLRIHRGCDFHLSFDNIQRSLDAPARFTINHKSYILVEFSDLQIAGVTDEIFGRMLAAGMRPIITHPERNPLLQKNLERIRSWVNGGCLVQVTAQSLSGRFGRTAKAAADALLEDDLVHFLASDAHDTRHRPPVLDEAYRYVEKAYGAERARQLCIANPTATLTGEWFEPAAAEPVPQSGKWYRFW